MVCVTLAHISGLDLRYPDHACHLVTVDLGSAVDDLQQIVSCPV